MRLIETETGRVVDVGDYVKTFRGNLVKVTGMTPPHKAGSTGRVYVVDLRTNTGSAFFPGVIGAKWTVTA